MAGPSDAKPWIALPDLERDLTERLNQLREGRATTYGALARSLGDPVAARWVAECLLTHLHTPECRCHRVVRAGGDLGLYGEGGTPEKVRRLMGDGIPVLDEAIPPDCLQSEFEGSAPLRELQAFQESVFPRLDLARPLPAEPGTIGALDVAYPVPGLARAAYVLMHAATMEPLWSLALMVPVRFPYITTYLTFRELPAHEAIWREVVAAGRVPDVVFVDGTGILHPRRAGIAATFGMFARVPTIGVTKSHLTGRLAGPLAPLVPVPILEGDELLGAAILPGSGTAKPVYVSPGNLICVQDATRLVLGSFRQHRVPEPIYLADRLSKSAED